MKKLLIITICLSSVVFAMNEELIDKEAMEINRSICITEQIDMEDLLENIKTKIKEKIKHILEVDNPYKTEDVASLSEQSLDMYFQSLTDYMYSYCYYQDNDLERMEYINGEIVSYINSYIRRYRLKNESNNML